MEDEKIQESELQNIKQIQTEKIDELLIEFTNQRNELLGMIKTLKELAEKIDKLFPDTVDARYMRLFEEKVKAATEFFKTLLDVRKEVSKSLKDEIEIRKRMDPKTVELEQLLISQIDIRSLAKKVEGYKKIVSDREESKQLLIEEQKIEEGKVI
jgi:hypothetical protein